MDEKWRLALWAAAAAKDMEFAATQRSAIPFVEEGLTFFDKLTRALARVYFLTFPVRLITVHYISCNGRLFRRSVNK